MPVIKSIPKGTPCVVLLWDDVDKDEAVSFHHTTTRDIDAGEIDTLAVVNIGYAVFRALENGVGYSPCYVMYFRASHGGLQLFHDGRYWSLVIANSVYDALPC